MQDVDHLMRDAINHRIRNELADRRVGRARTSPEANTKQRTQSDGYMLMHDGRGVLLLARGRAGRALSRAFAYSECYSLHAPSPFNINHRHSGWRLGLGGMALACTMQCPVRTEILYIYRL